MATEPRRFVHLHLHSEYSLLDGANRIERLIARVKELGMDAVAVTDHGNLFGAIEFYTQARAAGIKPILGIEAYVAPDIDSQRGDRRDRTHTGFSDGGFHLVLLAENDLGWHNLLKLSSDSYIHGFYYRPRMDKSTLAQWSDGLIAINGHLGSSLAHHLRRYEQTGNKNDYQRACEEARWHAEVFSPNERGDARFYIELQRHSVAEQMAINPHLQQLADELDLPLVCDNDAHFLLEADHDAHDTLCCISMGKTKDDPNRFHYPRDLYVKSIDEMYRLFEDVPAALENTVRIADRCHVDIDFSQSYAPIVKIIKTVPSETGEIPATVGSTEWYTHFRAQYELRPFDTEQDDTPAGTLKTQCDEALSELADAGAVWRYGQEGITDEVRKRLDRELSILAAKNFSAYFLIVWDFVNEARRNGIPANARGSAVSTMVGYCLDLSNACPIRYGLLFERFTDPDRSDYPDIDIDICQDGRQQIIDYVRGKYGHVAQIITFGTLKARAAIRDVGRVLNLPLVEVDKICKLVGDSVGNTLDKALDQEPELRLVYEEQPAHRTVIDTARRLEGTARHAGVHAAGVVIATEPLDNIIPLYQPPGTDQLVTQWDGPTVEKMGLLKMDFLGLRTLSIIERALQLIRASFDEATIRTTVYGTATSTETDPLDLDRLRFDDQRVLDLFRRGETYGIFQFESGGMRNTLVGMKPDRLEDLIAANALFRPGPMELIADYNDRKHGRKKVPSIHPIVDRFTDETYGIMVYQEQVMQIVHELGGIPLGTAYKLIKAISKKKSDVIDAVRPKFTEGAVARGLEAGQANELFELVLKFAGYGFNKSHSTGYAIIAYETAYLKTYFPIQYMAALLTYESVNTNKLVEYIEECRRVLLPDGRRGIDIKQPDINLSEVVFTVVFGDDSRDASHGHIRFGLSAVKGVGEKAVESILAVRREHGPFLSLFEFCERVSLTTVNRATIDALIKCGAFDSVHGATQRAAMVEALDSAIQAGQSAASDRDAGQLSFFDAFVGADTSDGAAPSDTPLPDAPAWCSADQLRNEKSVLGFYVSCHPLDEHQACIEKYSNSCVSRLKQMAAESTVVIGGIITRIRTTVAKQGRSAGQKMAMISFDDHTGSIDGVIFSEAYAIFAPLLVEDAILFLKGKVDRRREEPSVVVDEVIAIEQADERLTRIIKIVLRDSDNGLGPIGLRLNRLKQLLHQSAGGNGDAAEVVIEVQDKSCVATLHLNGLRVRVDKDLPHRIETVLSTDGCCQLMGAGSIVR